MYLYNVTLQRGGNVQCAIYGSFSAPKTHELVVSRTKVLELIRPDANGKLQVIASTEVFGCIRSLCPFRLPGANRDHVVVGSDSGRIVILQFDAAAGRFTKVHQETYGKSGCRRIVPGQYLAQDPKGRAVMIGAVEKQKLVYVLNRDSSANLTISSPLEAHKSHNLVFSLVGLDCGFDNPVFAAIELDYGESDGDPTGQAAREATKHLTYYELDLGLNHVLRKWTCECDRGASMLMGVPGGADGPGGVIICAEDAVVYKHQGHDEVRCLLPRRSDLPEGRGTLLVSYAAHKQKSMFFFLVQSEYGDIYKVTLDHSGEQVRGVTVRYFDTIQACNSLCVLKTGFLFAATEFGGHALYQFQGIGDDEGEVEQTSAAAEAVRFDPRPLKNLLLIDEMGSVSPVCGMRMANLFGEETKQLFSLVGRGPYSSLKVLRPGQTVAEMAVSPLPGSPSGVWTVKRAPGDTFDAYIVVSFKNATLVLSVGETVEEVSDSGFLATTGTLDARLLQDGSLLQVTSSGLRHILADGRVNEWRCPGRKQVTSVSSNERQVVVALTGYELVYFELDQAGQLLETEKKDMAGEISSVCVAPVPEGKLRSKFLAVGGYDATVRVLSLDPQDCLGPLAVQAVSAVPSSMLFLAVPASAGAGGSAALYLQAGLANGVLLRTEIDAVTGQLSDTRTRFLGTTAPKLFPAEVEGQPAVVALSSRPWLGRVHQGRFVLAPLSYEPLSFASGFSSEQCPEAVVAVAKTTLRILAVEHLGEAFNQASCALRHTPRCMAIHEAIKCIAVAEADHGVTGELTRPAANGAGEAAEHFGAARSGSPSWASCVELIDAAALSVVDTVQLEPSQCATCVALVELPAGEGGQAEALLAVGVAENLRLCPREADGGEIQLYRFEAEDESGGRKLALVHSTKVAGIPRALAAFQGRLLAGIGNSLVLFEMGRKRLLKKCENRGFQSFIVSIDSLGDRIYVGHAQDSLSFCKYGQDDNQIHVYADDACPRYLTCCKGLDYDTVAAGDKFGNLFVARLPKDASRAVEDDPTGGKAAGAPGSSGAPHKLDQACSFHLGDTVTALERAAMQPGGKEVLLYMTILGEVGALVPVTSREDVDLLSHLEMHLRQESPPLLGRDHMSFRSAYFPVRNVIDGGLCEQFSQLPAKVQRRVAEELDRTPGEVLKKLEDLRNKVM